MNKEDLLNSLRVPIEEVEKWVNKTLDYNWFTNYKECFATTFDEYVENPKEWYRLTTHTRDSRLLELSNAEYINSILEVFYTDEEKERETKGDKQEVCCPFAHFCSLVGKRYGWWIRLKKDGKVTDLARVVYEKIEKAYSEYPVLDEDGYSKKEYEAALESIKNEIPYSLSNYTVTPEEIFTYIWGKDSNLLENIDDNGAYVEDYVIADAMWFLEKDEKVKVELLDFLSKESIEIKDLEKANDFLNYLKENGKLEEIDQPNIYFAYFFTCCNYNDREQLKQLLKSIWCINDYFEEDYKMWLENFNNYKKSKNENNL